MQQPTTNTNTSTHIHNSHSHPQSTNEEFYGINKKWYKNISDNYFLPGYPTYPVPNDAYQTVHLPKHDILQQSLKRQVESIVFAETFINQIVYDCKQPSPYTKDLNANSYGMDVLPYYIPRNREDNILVFESRFECGNLRRVIQKCEFEYNLILSTDFNTNGHTQWYYFSIANTRKNVEYRFNIINLLKPDSLYNVGMKPLFYSYKNAEQKNVGWHRDGDNICYYTTNLKRKSGGYYSCLSFTVKFQNDYDNILIAHCYPYTYTQLQRYLKGIESDPSKKNKFQRKFLCLTESGNNCDYLTIGSDTSSQRDKDKKCIILTARVHPGETMASYIIEYMIDFLLGPSQAAKNLRENFIIKIVPMLNIDGVIIGNYRCNLSGADLNRQWLQPSKKSHPTVYYTKMLIKKTKQEREVIFCCDIHGHNRKKNTFLCGKDNSVSAKKQQIFPILMKNNCAVFSFKDCCFQVQKDRQGSARIALWKQFNIINCYTLESSFCGSDFDIAWSFCTSLNEYYDGNDQSKFKKAQEELESYNRNGSKMGVGMGDEKKNDSEDSDYSGDENEIMMKEKGGQNDGERRVVGGGFGVGKKSLEKGSGSHSIGKESSSGIGGLSGGAGRGGMGNSGGGQAGEKSNNNNQIIKKKLPLSLKQKDKKK